MVRSHRPRDVYCMSNTDIHKDGKYEATSLIEDRGASFNKIAKKTRAPKSAGTWRELKRRRNVKRSRIMGN